MSLLTAKPQKPPPPRPPSPLRGRINIYLSVTPTFKELLRGPRNRANIISAPRWDCWIELPPLPLPNHPLHFFFLPPLYVSNTFFFAAVLVNAVVRLNRIL